MSGMDVMSLLALFPIALIIGFLLIYVYVTSEYLYWEKRNVPFIKPVFPYGNIEGLVRNKIDIGRCFKAMYDQMPGEKYFGIFELGKPTLVLKDPELIKAIMVTDFYNFADRGHIHENVKKDFVAALNLFNLKDESWKRMRLKLSPAFSSRRMKTIYQLMVKCSQQLDQFLDRAAVINEKVEFRDLLARFTSDVISSCFFGLETNAIIEENSRVREISRIAIPKTTVTMIKLLLSINQPFIYDLLGLTINLKEVNDFCMKIAKDTYDYRVKNNVYRDDFIDLLIKIKQNKNLDDDENFESQGPRQSQGADDGLTFEEMTAHIFVIFLAGFETSSTTLSLALYEMCKHPDILKKAVEEIDSVLIKYDSCITYQALKEMAYLEQVIYETLRLYPSAPILTRKCIKTYKVPKDDLIIEKGLRVVIPSYAINTDPEVYPDPLMFNPDRFSPANVRERKMPNLQFGHGPMVCIGMRFGKMQVKCALATILSKYEVYVVPETPDRITINPRQFLTTPVEQLYLGVGRRMDR